MSFVYPGFLWALLFLIVPIIIHLFYFKRYKTVFFTNVHLLKEVKEQTAARSRIKHLLVLICRILAIAALVFAFAMPFIPDENDNIKQGSRDVSIYFDNSFSMSAEMEDQRLLERARMRAEEIAQAYDVEDKIQILTADFEGRDQRLLSKEDALNRISEIQISYATKELSKVIARQKAALESGKNDYKDIYIISDFQENASDLSALSDSFYKVHLIPLQSIQNRNIGIDSVWFATPVPNINQANILYIRVQNYGATAANNAKIAIELDGQMRPGGLVSIPANEFVIDSINLTITNTGWHTAKVSVTDFPIEFDNDYFFSFYVAEKLEILELYDAQPNNFIKATFAQNKHFQHTAQALNQLDYSKLPQYSLVILDELKAIPSGLISELTTYIKNGGNVVVFPALQGNMNDYNNLSAALNANQWAELQNQKREVSTVNYEDFIFNDVFEDKKDNLKLPSTSQNFKMNRKASEETLLRYRDGAPFLTKHINGRGHLYLCAAPLQTNISSLVQNGEIFVPMLYRMALSTAKEQKIAYTIGLDNNIESVNRTSNSELVYKMQGENGEFIPEQRAIAARVVLGVNDQVKTAGIYKLYYTPQEVLENYAFNYDRRESQMKFLNASQLESLTNGTATIIEGSSARDFTNLISKQNKGTSLWKLCLVLALVFLLAETVLLRIMKS